MASQGDPLLEINHAPVFEEHELTAVEHTGTLPASLEGLYCRNGGNPKFLRRGQPFHFFDGDGMVHGVLFRDKRCYYANKFVRTDKLATEDWLKRRLTLTVGTIISGSFSVVLQEILLSMFSKWWFGWRDMSTANTALVFHDRRLLALQEGSPPYHILAPNLETLGPYTYDGKLKHSFTAHPKLDPDHNKLYMFGYSPQPPYCQYSVVDSNGDLLRTSTIDIPKPVMMHDFACSKKYACIMDLPYQLDMEILRKEGPPMLRFQSDIPARFGLFDREIPDPKNPNVQWFEARTCYVFHTANLYEENEAEVVLTACRYENINMSVDDALQRENGPFMHEWRFNLETGKTEERRLCDIPGEFPLINPSYAGKKHRYVYFGRIQRNPENPKYKDLMDAAVKFDHISGQTFVYKYGDAEFGGEPFFQPSGGEHEDDGFLLTFVHNEETKQSYLAILDARTMSLLSRVNIPYRVPYGFHGLFVPADKLVNQRRQLAKRDRRPIPGWKKTIAASISLLIGYYLLNSKKYYPSISAFANFFFKKM